MKQTEIMDNQSAAIWKEFEEEVDNIVRTMTAGATTSSGGLEWNSSLDDESDSKSEDVSRIIHEILEVDNQRLTSEVGRCQDEIHKLQQENAEQLRQMGLLKNKMMDILNTSIDKLKASGNSEREMLRSELESAKQKILELEAEREVTHRDGEVKFTEMKSKDNLIEDLFSLVESLERSYEKKSREVDQLKEELARENRVGQRTGKKMGKELESKIDDIILTSTDELISQLLMTLLEESDNPVMANSAPDPTTPLVEEAVNSGSDGRGTTQVNEIKGPVETGMGTVDDNELGGTSSGSSSSDSPSLVINLRKRNIEVACGPSGSDSSSKRAKPINQITNKSMKTPTSSSKTSASLKNWQTMQQTGTVNEVTPGGNPDELEGGFEAHGVKLTLDHVSHCVRDNDTDVATYYYYNYVIT